MFYKEHRFFSSFWWLNVFCPHSLNSDYSQETQMCRMPQVDNVAPSWSAQTATNISNSTSFFGPRNVFSYPVSDLTPGRFPFPQAPNFVHPFQTPGPFFPSLWSVVLASQSNKVYTFYDAIFLGFQCYCVFVAKFAKRAGVATCCQGRSFPAIDDIVSCLSLEIIALIFS